MLCKPNLSGFWCSPSRVYGVASCSTPAAWLPLPASAPSAPSLSERYKYDNIIAQDLDMPERTTQEYEGPGMVGLRV